MPRACALDITGKHAQCARTCSSMTAESATTSTFERRVPSARAPRRTRALILSAVTEARRPRRAQPPGRSRLPCGSTRASYPSSLKRFATRVLADADTGLGSGVRPCCCGSAPASSPSPPAVLSVCGCYLGEVGVATSDLALPRIVREQVALVEQVWLHRLVKGWRRS